MLHADGSGALCARFVEGFDQFGGYETSVGIYVDSIVKLVENAEQRLATYGGQTGAVVDDFMNRLQIQGLVRDEKGRARTPEEIEQAAMEEAQAQADAPFWQNVWGRIDPDSLKRDFPDARNELAKLHGRGLFARKGEGLPIDELADILKTLDGSRRMPTP